jgi:hypothetical protein
VACSTQGCSSRYGDVHVPTLSLLGSSSLFWAIVFQFESIVGIKRTLVIVTFIIDLPVVSLKAKNI